MTLTEFFIQTLHKVFNISDKSTSDGESDKDSNKEALNEEVVVDVPNRANFEQFRKYVEYCYEHKLPIGDVLNPDFDLNVYSESEKELD